jgi:flagellar biosynthesis protein FlhF
VRVRTFEAVDMKRALQLVKEELGPRAVIVSSRSVRRDRGRFGLLGRRVLEVTAAAEEPKREEPPALRGPVDQAVPPPRGQGAFRDLWAIRQAVDPLVDEMRGIRDTVSTLGEHTSNGPEELRSDLVQIRSMLASLVGSSGIAGDPEGTATQRLYYLLVSRGIDEPLARILVQRVLTRVEAGALGDLDRLKLALAGEMRADLARAERGGPPGRIQIFVGPSGVGKTTTIAKLAARAARSAPDGVLIVTTDVHRVGAVEQMARFGEILGVPVESATGPEDLARVAARAHSREHVFVDTSGRCHREPGALRELQALAEAVQDAELLLVTAATARAVDSRDTLDAYAALPVSRLILTKLDETRVYGELYNAVVWSGRPIAAVTTGRAVPDQLEAVDIAGILQRVLDA